MENNLDAEIIIVGAGPSGLSAAKTLFEKGIDVLVIDKSEFPREKVCAGGLMQHTFRDYPFIKEFIDNYIYNVRVYSPNMKYSFEVHSGDLDKPLMATTKSRMDFDNKMYDMVKSMGCKIITGEKINAIHVNQDFIEVKTQDNKNYKSLAAIGADSAISTVAKCSKIGLYNPSEKLDKSKEIGFAFEKEIPYITGTEEKNQNTVHLFLHYNGMDGYAWVFPRSTGSNIGIGGLGSQTRIIKSKFPEFEQTLINHEIIPNGKDFVDSLNKSKSELKGAILPATRPYKKLVSNRVILVGDAGGFCSAATGEGIYYGMKSGEISANFLVNLVNKYRLQKIDKNNQSKNTWQNGFSEKRLSGYERLIRRTLRKELNFQYFVKNYVIMSGRRCKKAIRWGMHDKKLAEIFTKFLTGEQTYKSLRLKMVYNYIRCKIIDKFHKLG